MTHSHSVSPRRRGLASAFALGSLAAAAVASAQTPRLDRPAELRAINVEAVTGRYLGRAALRLVDKESASPAAGGEKLAIMPGTEFEDGAIEDDVAGLIAKDASADARGFVGVAFDVLPDGSRFKSFYLRPSNARALDQLRRNHTTQFVSIPEFPWYTLREKEAGVYESYVDLDPVAWIRMRIVVDGGKASLYVNGAEQPCLIVNDLKHAARGGAIALWIGAGTEAYFSNLRIERR